MAKTRGSITRMTAGLLSKHYTLVSRDERFKTVTMSEYINESGTGPATEEAACGIMDQRRFSRLDRS